MRKSDEYRMVLIENIIKNNEKLNNRLSIDFDSDIGIFSEIITIEDINEVTYGFTTHKNVEDYLKDFTFNRLSKIGKNFGFKIINELVDINTTDFYDGYELHIPIMKENYTHIDELFNEIDNEINPDLINKATDVPLTKEPTVVNTPNIPLQNKIEKTQNPKRVDLILKTVFNDKFLNYKLKTDAGDWKAVKGLSKDGKLLITWENQSESSILMETLLFPADTNKIMVEIKTRTGETLLSTYFEIYRIPTLDFLAEKFYRKTLFALLKKYIDTSVIQIDPFRVNFVFWKTDNPNFSYSFSTPNKNRIILDLITFISTAMKPILDDFFEQNNLKHKQGYLQTLLDSAEAAGIFKFKREGNEILILRGPNYRAFLKGKIRRVT